MDDDTDAHERGRRADEPRALRVCSFGREARLERLVIDSGAGLFSPRSPVARVQTNLKVAHHVRDSIIGGSNLPSNSSLGLMSTESAMPRANPG